eukprot:s101_g3.t1
MPGGSKIPPRASTSAIDWGGGLTALRSRSRPCIASMPSSKSWTRSWKGDHSARRRPHSRSCSRRRSWSRLTRLLGTPVAQTPPKYYFPAGARVFPTDPSICTGCSSRWSQCPKAHRSQLRRRLWQERRAPPSRSPRPRQQGGAPAWSTRPLAKKQQRKISSTCSLSLPVFLGRRWHWQAFAHGDALLPVLRHTWVPKYCRTGSAHVKPFSRAMVVAVRGAGLRRRMLLLRLARRWSQKKEKNPKRKKDNEGKKKQKHKCKCRNCGLSEARRKRRHEGRKRTGHIHHRRSRRRKKEAADVAFHFAGDAKAHRSNPKQSKGWFHWIPAVMDLHFDPITNTAFDTPRKVHMLDFGRERLTFSVADTSRVVKLCLRDQADEKFWAEEFPELVAPVYWTGQVTVRLFTVQGFEDLTLYGLWQKRVETAKEWIEGSSTQVQQSFMTYTCAVLAFLALQGIQLRDTGRSNLGLLPGSKDSGAPRLIFYDVLDWSRGKRGKKDFRWSQYWNYAKSIVPDAAEWLRLQVSEARRDPFSAAKHLTDRCQEYKDHLEAAGVLSQGAFVLPSWQKAVSVRLC